MKKDPDPAIKERIGINFEMKNYNSKREEFERKSLKKIRIPK